MALIVAPAAIPGPVMIMFGQRFAVLPHTTVVLAIVVDTVIMLAGRAITPWVRATRGARVKAGA